MIRGFSRKIVIGIRTPRQVVLIGICERTTTGRCPIQTVAISTTDWSPGDYYTVAVLLIGISNIWWCCVKDNIYCNCSCFTFSFSIRDPVLETVAPQITGSWGVGYLPT